jgi:hypothetical protein
MISKEISGICAVQTVIIACAHATDGKTGNTKANNGTGTIWRKAARSTQTHLDERFNANNDQERTTVQI